MTLITLGGKSRRPFVIYTLAAPVAEARHEGDEIVGRYTDEPAVELRRSNSVLVEFLICRDDPSSILLFTRIYGPCDPAADEAQFALEGRPFCPPLVGDGAEFRFSVTKWREFQRKLRQTWESVIKEEVNFPDTLLGWMFCPSRYDKLMVSKGRLAYQVSGLSRYMRFELATTNPERLRICRKADCQTPFIAAHLRQEYCNDVCAGWGQRQAKLKWWKEHPRPKPKKKGRRAKHVTRRRVRVTGK